MFFYPFDQNELYHPPISIENMRFYEIMIIWQTVPLTLMECKILMKHRTSAKCNEKIWIGCVNRSLIIN